MTPDKPKKLPEILLTALLLLLAAWVLFELAGVFFPDPQAEQIRRNTEEIQRELEQ